MLSSLKFSACRTLPRYSRTFIRAESLSQGTSPLEEARNVLDALVEPTKDISSPTTSKSPSSSTIPLYYDLPPEKDPILQLLTTKLMKHGHYSKAQKIVADTLLNVHTFTRAPPLPILHEAILKASPAVRTVQHKRGGRTTLKPMALSERQRTSQGISWIMEASKKKPGLTMQLRLAKELISVIKGDSTALTEKENAHKLAMVSRGSLTSRRR